MLTHHNATPQDPKRVIVIGAGGFVGSTIVAELGKAGIPAVAIGQQCRAIVPAAI